MNLVLRRVILAAAATVLGLGLLTARSSHAASGEEVIDARIQFMKNEVNDLWRPLGAYAKNGDGSLADVEKNARALAKISERFLDHFPKDTGRGKYSDRMTRSLPVIWSDPDGFKKAIQVMAEESEKLARLAREGNKPAVVALIGPTGSYPRSKMGCAGCHEKFRSTRE